MLAKIVLGLLATITLACAASAQTVPLVTEEMMVKAADPGINIFVRNKRPASMVSFRPERTVLFVHGATYPAETTFDMSLDGQSWMDYIAARGYDVYLLDPRAWRALCPRGQRAQGRGTPAHHRLAH